MSEGPRLRIAVLQRHFGYRFGGAERYAAAIAEALSARHEVHVFAQEIEHAHAGITYHRVSRPLAKPRWFNQLWFALQTWRQTRHGFDIVHSHENTWHGQVQTVHVRPFRIGLFHGLSAGKRWLRWLSLFTSPRLLTYWCLEAARFAPRADRCIVATSDHVRHETVAGYPHTAWATQVIPPGVNMPSAHLDPTQARLQLQLPVDVPMALFVGNDFDKKGLPTLLQALSQVQGLHLAVVGEGRHLERYRQQIQTLGLTTRVHLLGSLPDVTAAYAAADWLAHPTTEDTYAMVVLEAMAHGLPVIVSSARYCGISAELKHGVDALILEDPRDAGALAELLRRTLEDRELRNKLAQAGLPFARERTWSRAAQRHEALIHHILSPQRQRWLILAHAFNMDGRASSQTITDKMPHLLEAGIEPVVLSGVMGAQDQRFEHHRLWSSGPSGIRFEMRHVLRQRLSHPVLYRLCMTLISLLLLPTMLIERLLYPVESSWSWQFSAARRGRQLARQRPFDLVYSTGGAVAAHLAAHRLQRQLGIPWLAEIHDPFVLPGTQPSNRRQRFFANAESLICQHANVAIWFTQQALDSARRRNPALGERGHVMLPGVDSPFAGPLPPYSPGSRLVIGHFGSLSATRTLKPFMHAWHWLEQHAPEVSRDMELHIYGGTMDSTSAELATRWGLQDRIRPFGRIETDPLTGESGRSQVLRHMRACDVLLLVHGEEAICEEYIPSKVYEYLWMQRPILATVHDNPQMAEILRGQGHCVAQSSLHDGGSELAAPEMAVHLKTLWTQWQARGLTDSGRLSPYTTRASTAQLMGWAGTMRAAQP